MIELLNETAGNLGGRCPLHGDRRPVRRFSARLPESRERLPEPRRTIGVLRRMKGAGEAVLEGGPGILLERDHAPSGVAQAFLPTKTEERNKVRRELEFAGFTGPNAVLVYYGVRIGFGLISSGPSRRHWFCSASFCLSLSRSRRAWAN